jgi:hypothetical protein
VIMRSCRVVPDERVELALQSDLPGTRRGVDGKCQLDRPLACLPPLSATARDLIQLVNQLRNSVHRFVLLGWGELH